MMTIRRKTWTRMGLLLLLAGLAGWGMWRWSVPKPETMRLVATIPVPKGSMVQAFGMGAACFGVPGGVYLRVKRLPGGLATLTLVGWDLAPKWSVTVPLDKWVFDGELFTGLCFGSPYPVITVSPDGRVFAMARVGWKTTTITSWRDGTLLGIARLPWAPTREMRAYGLAATNSGRVWVYDSYMEASECRLRAIDGFHVACGAYPVSFSQAQRVFVRLSPAGAGLLCFQPSATLDYVTLDVQGEAVQATRRYALPIEEEDFAWLDDTRARSFADAVALIGPDGLLNRVRGGRSRKYPAQERPWRVPTTRMDHFQQQTTPDQRTALVDDWVLQWPRRRRTPGEQPLTGGVANLWRARYAIYTAPGRLRAVLPMTRENAASAWHNGTRLSQDGRRMAVLVECGKQWEIHLYRWGND